MSGFPEYIQNPVCWALFLGGMIMTAVLTPGVMWFARKVGAVDEGGYRKVYKGQMPLLGGLAIALPFFLMCAVGVFAGFLSVEEQRGAISLGWLTRIGSDAVAPLARFAEMRLSLFVLAVGGMAIVALGVIDDVRGLRARSKFLVQAIVAVFLCATGYSVSSMDLVFMQLKLGPVLGMAFTVVWVVGVINAFNLIDGVDGLASGIALIATIALAVLGGITGSTFLLLVSLALAGSLVAFLTYNFFPARIFLGDTGSMFLGYVLAATTVMGRYKPEAGVIILAPMLALSFPIFETLVSMIRRYIRGVPIFSGDRKHTHHRLLDRGYSQRQVVLLLYAVAGMLGLAAILTRVFRPEEGSFLQFVPYLLIVVALGGILWLAGYLRPASFHRIYKRRSRTSLLNMFARYAIMSLSEQTQNQARREELFRFACSEMHLRFLEAWFEIGKTRIAGYGEPRVESGAEKYDAIERVRVNSHAGYAIVLRFEFDHDPCGNERQDVTAALVHAFENANLNPPSAEVVSVAVRLQKEDAALQQVAGDGDI